VEGEKNYRFCPAYPSVSYLDDEEIMRSTQTEFYAVDLDKKDVDILKGEFETLKKLRIHKAESHKNLYHMASVWDNENSRMIDGTGSPGPRIVNFSNILKYKVFPLAEIVKEVLAMAQIALGIPVEIEFAVDLTKNAYEEVLPTFYLLQVRPMTVNFDETIIDFVDVQPEELVLYTEEGLGNGVIEDIYDIVFIDPEKFDKTKTAEMAEELERINNEMKEKKREYILMGPGRWGTRDRFLGIPVIWSQISKAKIIVEAGLEDYEIEPSQGTHFFHNVIAMNIGYFNVPFKKKKKAFIDWEYIKTFSGAIKHKYTTHIVNEKPFKVVMDGKNRKSVIYK
jgi:hypothetical protein